jgi:DNA polymerase-3 subunit alpha
MSTRFVHLLVHTEYSLVDSLVRIGGLIKAVRAADMPACAITDHSNLFALVKFYRAAQSAGVKPIIGVDLKIREPDNNVSRLVLLCQNLVGYRNLTRIVSRSYTEGQVLDVPYVQRAWLEGSTDGLIALSGGRLGDVGKALVAGHYESAKQRLQDWDKLFPQRFYLELQRTGRPEEEDYIHAAVTLATEMQMPVVATNDVCFLHSEDFKEHEVRVCIHTGHTLIDPRRPQLYSPQQYLRTPEEMAELFSDIPEALENTWLIAQRCNLELTLGKNFLPDFPIPDPNLTPDAYFRQCSEQGLEARLQKLFGNRPNFAELRAPYDERLEIELKVIEQMGFAGYFLIVADFIQWAKDHNIPVGPGRGSGAGSLVAYALKITDLDPLPYDLLFERFLNPERVSMPDFDIDFCMDQRDDVIQYVAERYGRDKVSQIITYGSMAAKAVVRDVGRALNHPYGFVDKIAKLIPFELGITLDKALEQEPALKARYEQEEDVKLLIDTARKLEGLTRNVGKHAGGVVIAPSTLTDFTPLYCEQDSPNLVTQFDKDDVEAVGLVKFDFLGLRNLTVIKWALEIINRFSAEPIDILSIPLDDAKTFKLLKNAETTAVFQLESRGMKDLIKRLQPDCFEDIVALVALFRPGPLQSGMVDDFINRKHRRVEIEYLHSYLNNNQAVVAVLKPTYGVIVYQEQVMQIAQVLSGYTLGGADLLRRAMGKKKPEEMAKQRSGFVEGAQKNNIPPEVSSYVFDLVEKFAAYGFNKSHSAAYALVSYQTAWLKAHYPAAFMAAALSSDMDNTDKVVILVNECHAMGLEILPPDINECEYMFTVPDNTQRVIYYGLGAIKGLGEAAIKNAFEERKRNGKFKDLFDFCKRVDLRKVNRRALEAMIKAGALDNLGGHRAALMQTLEKAIKTAEQHSAAQSRGQNDIFGSLSAVSQNQVREEAASFSSVAEWTLKERLTAEKESLGIYLSGHPIDEYRAELAQLIRTPLANVRPAERQTVRVAGIIAEIRHINSRRGRFASVRLEDSTDKLEVMIFSELYQTKQEILVLDQLLIAEGEVREDTFNGGFNLNAQKVLSIAQAREEYARKILVEIEGDTKESRNGLAKHLVEILSPHRQGRCPFAIEYMRRDAKVEITLGNGWQLRPSPELLNQLKDLLGSDKVRLQY